MAKYTAKDEDVKSMYLSDRVDYDVFLVNYDVDANAETSQGKSAILMIRDTVRTGKFQPIKNLYNLYTLVYALLISIAFLLVIILIILIIVYGIAVLINKDEITKLQLKLLLMVLLFFIGVLVLIYLFTRFKDSAQTNLEKIVYVL